MITDTNNVVLETAQLLNQPTLSELVDQLVKQKGFKFKEATKAVYIEWKKGTLEFTDSNPPSSMQGYFFSLESSWFWAVTALVAVTVFTVFAVNSSVLLYVRYILGGFFVLFLPGFMLISVLYPRSGELDGLEKLALSIGLSLAIVPLIGLLLNYTPWGIRLEPIMFSMVTLAEALAVAIIVRRFRYHKLSLK